MPTHVRVTVLVIGLALVSVGAWTAAKTDWYAYGPAKPPKEAAEIDSSRATLEQLRIGEIDALKHPVAVKWSQHLPVMVSAQCPANTFEVTDARRMFSKRKPPGGSERETASIFIKVLRKSSLNGGVARVSACGSGATVDKKQRLRWTGKLWIPHVPGDYLGQVCLVSSGEGSSRSRKTEERIIATFALRVLPGDPAASK